jgi:hypothetical protein
MEKLAAAPSSWRILNLNRAMRTMRQTHGQNAPGFFNNKRLACSIVIKHTLRDHERDMFDNPPVIATKVLVPLDENALASGAVSFFVGERSYPAIMRQTFAINVTATGHDRVRDAVILDRLNETPSLDLFLLRELLGDSAFGIAGDYFQVSLLEDTAIRSYITKELTPLIRIAVDHADMGRVGRFVDSIFGSEIGEHAGDFFKSLGLDPDTWTNVVFAWKAALFYETQFAATHKRFDLMRSDLARLKTYGHTEDHPRSSVNRHLSELRAFAGRSHLRSVESARRFNSTRRAAIIQSGNVGELAAYLRALPDNVLGFGAFRAVTDHILSYWDYRTRGFDPTRMPAEVFCTVAGEICAMEQQFAPRDTMERDELRA